MRDSRRSWTFLDASVGQSFARSLALTLLPVISAFVVSWIVARFSGPTVWGTVSWAMAFATSVLIVAKLGLDLGASRMASDFGVSAPGKLRALFNTAFGIRLVATVLCAAIVFIGAGTIAVWFGKPWLDNVIRISAIIVLSTSIYEFQEQFLIGLNRLVVVSRVRSVMLSSRVALTAALVATGAGAGALLGGYVAAWAVGIVAFGLLLFRFLPATGAGSDRAGHLAMRRRLLKISIPLAISGASVTIYSQMDKLMLGYFDTVDEVGHYAIARAVVEVSLFPSFALVMTLRPALASRFSRGALAECATIIRRSLRLSLVFGVLFASIFCVLSVPLLTAVYSAEFGYAGALLPVFSVVLVFRSVGALILPALVAAEQTTLYAWITAGSAVLNFGLNLLLIPMWHAKGAVVATMVSYGLLLAVGLWQVFGLFGVRIDLPAVLKSARTLLAGAISAGLTWQFLVHGGPQTGPAVLVVAAAHGVVFLLLAVVFGALRRDELVGAARKLLKVKG